MIENAHQFEVTHRLAAPFERALVIASIEEQEIGATGESFEEAIRDVVAMNLFRARPS